MTEDTKLSYTANHIYREGYDQGRSDVLEEVINLLDKCILATNDSAPERWSAYVAIKCFVEALQKEKR